MSLDIKYIKDTEGNNYFPVVHERGVVDDNGTTLESKLQSKQDAISDIDTIRNKANSAIQSITVGTTTTGEAGSSANVTNTGTATEPVLSFTIPQGAQGIQGIQGPQGERGPQGNTGVQVDSVASIIHSIDSTTTYAADDVAGADAVQDVLAEVTELAGEVTNVKDYVMPSGGVDVTYDESDCTSGIILRTSGSVSSFSGYMTSDFIAIPEGTEYIYTSGQLHTMNATYCGFKFYTSNSNESVISDNVAPTDGSSVPSTINMSDWPTAKYLRFCIHGTTGSVRFYTASGVSPIVGALIVQDLGDSEVKAVSQKGVTDAINAITADGDETIYDSTNSDVTNGVLKTTNVVQSMSGYITSSVINIPTGTQYIETHGLYDYTGTFTGLIFLTENNTPIVVGEAGSQIPKLIDLKDYPTATKLRWCARTSSTPSVKCYSYSKIKESVLSFTSDEIGDSDTTLVSQKGISNALAQMADELNGREYVILQSDPLTSANNNWTYGSGGSWSYTSNGATPTATGDTYYMRNTIPYYSDRRYMRTNVTMGIDTKLIIVCSFGDSLNAGGGASAFGIDFSAKKLIIYGVPAYNNVSGDGQITSVGYDLTKQLETTTIPDAMIGARKYVVELHKHGTISKLVLMDTLTGNSVYVAHDGWAAGRQNESYGFYCESGTLPTLSNFAVYSLKNPDIVFTGDSITEGVGVSDRSLSYPNRFRNSVRSKSVVISARGNLTIDTLMPLFDSEWNIVRPKMISVLIGANGGNTASKFAALKSACDAIDAELVVHYCSCRTGRDMSTNNDTLIPALGMESAHFDWATAIDNTPNSSYSNINNALFSDSVHPNEDGHGEMFKRLRIDSICLFI